MFKLILTILVVFVCTISGQSDSKVHVAIYYESLCKDSYKFITEQLGVVYDYVEDYVDILFVPFGKAESINGGESFQCQHDEPECEGNMMQSCALHLLTLDQRKQTEFVKCQMNISSDKTGQVCSEQVGLNFEDVLACTTDGTGKNLQLMAETLTNLVSKPLTFVPTIVYNDEFDQYSQDRTIKDFLTVLCEQLDDLGNTKLPIICTDPY